jgi:cytochrome c oxidase cbb3-type subunit 3
MLEGAALERARSLFNMVCANCHLQAGTGAPGRKSDGVPDFTDPAWHAARTDAQLRESLANGKGAVMPAFGTRLSPEQLDDLVRYVRGLSRR